MPSDSPLLAFGTDGAFVHTPWDGMVIGPLVPSVTIDGVMYRFTQGFRSANVIEFRTESCPVSLVQTLDEFPNGIVVRSALTVSRDKGIEINEVRLFDLAPENTVAWESVRDYRILEQGDTWGRTVPLFSPSEDVAGSSDLVSVISDTKGDAALLVGFVTARRWNGKITVSRGSDRSIRSFRIGFSGGDTILRAGMRVELEDIVVLTGRDPLDLLDQYAELAAGSESRPPVASPPVTWCSWYPHRLGVTHDKVMANARIGAKQLKPLGLSVMLVDLGWERGWLPSESSEKPEFSRGLRGLADDLAGIGLKLGAWASPTSIVNNEEMLQHHPDWLICDRENRPVEFGKWFWEPHGTIHLLDLTHPDARAWLFEFVRSLAERGVSYYKGDFAGMLSSEAAKRRYNREIVSGEGTETKHIYAQTVMDALASVDPRAMMLSCAGVDLPGPSRPDLLYTCVDTGNTGYVGWKLLKETQLTTATHLFKNHRWGIIQPSCTSVGLPGTLDEARVRATTSFMSGGQIDIGDDLTKLPEERWHVLTATLPPPIKSARVVDLFRPIRRTLGGYSSSTQTTALAAVAGSDAPPASVWTMPIDAGWDTWTLVAVYSHDAPAGDSERNESQLETYQLPLEQLKIDSQNDLFVYEFWSESYNGCLTVDPPPVPAYTHPGDMQTTIRRQDPETLSVSFFGPTVKLFAVRVARSHPWVVGTGFHQSCGFELSDVRWDDAAKRLSGRVNRPSGDQGSITVAGVNGLSVHAQVDGRDVPVRSGAFGSIVLPITVEGDGLDWELCFA